MNIKKRFGLKIKRLRKERKLSQEKLAEKAFLDRTYIGGVERGERNISLLNIEKIANALDLNIINLFEFTYNGE
ncbi:MAG: helix-turn-helix transcriptional regulator [Candidatus Eremiobacteraeota bacterium]|nr:helix-turn-helix transcriptional regulator [Candidatus Eremiobacteraeota bacterium]